MSEVAAATPAPEPATLEELIAGYNALVAVQNELVAAGNRGTAALCRALDAAKFTPDRMMTDAALLYAISAVRDRQQEARENAALIREAGGHIRAAAAVQSLRDLMGRRAELAPAAEPESELARHRHRKARVRTERRHLGLAPGAGGIVVPGAAAFGGILRHAVTAKHAVALAVTPATAAAAVAVAVVAIGPSHTLEDRMPWSPPPPRRRPRRSRPAFRPPG